MREDFNPPEKLLANQNGRCFNMAAMASIENDLLGFVSLFLLVRFPQVPSPASAEASTGYPNKTSSNRKIASAEERVP